MKKCFYIKERHNPQLGVSYFLLGPRTKKEAKRYEKSLYGDNYILEYKTEKEYKDAIEKLKSEGKKVFNDFTNI